MRDTDWEAIIALFESGNLTKAANMLFLSQPTLSKTIARIEEELGVQLIHRTNKGITFTEAGQYVVSRALDITRLIRETKDHCEMLSSGEKLQIGSASSFARYDLAKYMQGFHEHVRPCRYNVQVLKSTEIMDLIRRRELHIGFVNGDREWEHKQLCETCNGYIVSRDPIRLEDLPTLPMISHYTDAYSLKIILGWWHETFDTEMRITYSVTNLETSLNWISSGLGYGILYDNILNDNDHFHKIPMLGKDGSPVTRNTWAVYHPESLENPLLKDFLTYIKENSTSI